MDRIIRKLHIPYMDAYRADVTLIPLMENGDRINDAIIQGMSLEADARPPDIKAWLGLLGIEDRSKIWLERLKGRWLIVVTIIGFLAALAGLLNDGMGVLDRWFPPHNPPSPTESVK